MRTPILTLATLGLAQMPFLAQPALAATPSAFSDANWVALGQDLDVFALAVDTNGNVYVGSAVVTGRDSKGVAKWDGSHWSALGSGVGTGGSQVHALAFDAKGNLYAGGQFGEAGGARANCIAKWDGSAWSALGAGIGPAPGAWVNALACDTNGNLYAGGDFGTAGGVNIQAIAKWDGKTWSALGSGIAGTVYALACDAKGNLYAGGDLYFGGVDNGPNLAKWDGSAWSSLGSLTINHYAINGLPTPWVRALAVDGSGNLYAGGWFESAGSIFATNIAKWNGSTWAALGPGIDLQVWALAVDSSGNLYAGGDFTSAGGASAHSVARWDGSGWSALGSGVAGFAWVSAMAPDGLGNLYVGGTFTTAGTQACTNFAKALLTGPTPNRLLLANAGGGTNVITYLGTPGSRYALDLAASLAPPISWMPQATNAASTNNAASAGYVSFADSNRLPQAYYRTRLVQAQGEQGTNP
jgi:hypothetical protein